ncbi:MAG: DNA/RNA nuclease SfsA [Candidatus Omnitrophica bacterium]|nr:DNA/RNA nuclease SfsA [Candidatus Omnitrophota bacterium]MCM8806369.1 DNA/RNA nuclease SfsA [Candidatus Omnitrophota bacterium]
MIKFSKNTKMKEALFIERINKFTVKCEINNHIIKAYLPNSGRLWELLLPKRKLYLKEKNGNLNYKVFGVERNGYFICLDTHYTNTLVKQFLKKNIIKDLTGYKIKKEEFKIENTKIDFLIEKENKIVPLEVKSCTLFENNIAMFPDAITQRAKKHLEILEKNNGIILFIVYYPEAKYFLPEFHIDPLFSKKLYELRNKILIKAISVKWIGDEKFEFVKEIEIPWHIYEKEGKDKGNYLILGKLNNDIYLKIGYLENLFFKKGYYIYVGSAMNSLTARIKRHLKINKIKKWHIDYFIPYLNDLKSISIRSSENLECLVSNELEKISNGIIKNFGSTDCKCKSHLYFFENNPLCNEKFINILLKFRIGRLNKFF